MKKIFAFVLMLVLIFSFAVPSFASSHTSELDALNSIDDWSESIWQMLVQIGSSVYNIESDVDSIRTNSSTLVNHAYNILNNILDINEYSRLNNDELVKINTAFERLNLNLFGSTVWLQPFATAVKENLDYQKTAIDIVFGLGSNSWHNYDDSFFYHVDENLSDIYRTVDLFSERFNSFNSFFRQEFDENTGEGSAGYALYMLQQVLADEEDLALRESVSTDVSLFKDFFFNRDSNLNTTLDSTAIFQLSGSFSNIFSIFGSGDGSGVSSNIEAGFSTFNSLFDFPLSWFSESVSNDLNSAALFYSLDDSYVPELATSYYPTKEDRLSFLRGDLNG